MGKDTPDRLFEPLDRDPLAQRIAQTITDAILAGRLKPGDRVTESTIARDLGVSRSPVREAARLLQSAGLLVARPNRGFFVRTITADDLDSLYELRNCIEREAAARLTRADAAVAIPQLLQQLEVMRELASDGHLIPQIRADLQFHRLICEASGNKRFLSVFDQIASEMQACFALFERLFINSHQIVENHLLIIDALRSGDPEAARQAMDYHIGVARTDVVARFRALERNQGV
ncbi:GntR family transcriptional regulator [Qingshengfaniella alkalisoli]|uniref:GntR family transcriptional regulator n=1 Tax=Qingshengfaniella alkalisoli TaxID=2599296 RepID=A0A5B8J1J5_9RHOB|nr:GntR family transcriptional regulator [Qingshengfaniella alkalisoli]QDY71051.1 GntR family transcriptional regulator [Qingshengfaniella alkalisoli]